MLISKFEVPLLHSLYVTNQLCLSPLSLAIDLASLVGNGHTPYEFRRERLLLNYVHDSFPLPNRYIYMLL